MATTTVIGNVVTAVINRISDIKTAIGEATSTASGLMSAKQAEKLDGIADGANKTTIANNLTTQTAGMALDATQGKALNDALAATQSYSIANIDTIGAINSEYAEYASYEANVLVRFGKICIFEYGFRLTANPNGGAIYTFTSLRPKYKVNVPFAYGADGAFGYIKTSGELCGWGTAGIYVMGTCVFIAAD